MTSGYILPTHSSGFPGGLTLNQFVQTVITGVSALPGNLVRPQWQVSPPKQPDIDTNWLAFGILLSAPDTYAFVGTDSNGATISQRQQRVQVDCSIYGPDAFEIASLIQDGFQIPNNLQGLRAANMGFTETTEARRVPDLINERWVNRAQMSIILQRQIQRTYPIVTILSASGTMHTVLGNEQYLLDWATQN